MNPARQIFLSFSVSYKSNKQFIKNEGTNIGLRNTCYFFSVESSFQKLFEDYSPSKRVLSFFWILLPHRGKMSGN